MRWEQVEPEPALMQGQVLVGSVGDLPGQAEAELRHVPSSHRAGAFVEQGSTTSHSLRSPTHSPLAHIRVALLAAVTSAHCSLAFQSADRLPGLKFSAGQFMLLCTQSPFAQRWGDTGGHCANMTQRSALREQEPSGHRKGLLSLHPLARGHCVEPPRVLPSGQRNSAPSCTGVAGAAPAAPPKAAHWPSLETHPPYRQSTGLLCGHPLPCDESVPSGQEALLDAHCPLLSQRKGVAFFVQ